MATPAAVVAGVSFNRARLDAAIERTLSLPPGSVHMEVHNALAVRPSLDTEYFLSPHVSLCGVVNYVYTEPPAVVVSPVALFEDRWDAQCVNVSAGIRMLPVQDVKSEKAATLVLFFELFFLGRAEPRRGAQRFAVVVERQA